MDGGAGAIFSAINACFIFANVIAQLNDVPEEAARFSSLINRVRLDYNEALRLLTLPIVQAKLTSSPSEQRYIHGCIFSVKSALADIGRFVEKIRVQEDGILGGKRQVSLGRRCEWLWKYRSKVDSSERALGTAHKSLMGAMHRMVTWIELTRSSPLVTVVEYPRDVADVAMPLAVATGLSSPSMMSLPPPYPEAAERMNGSELDDGFVVARRRLTRHGQKKKCEPFVSADAVAVGIERTPDSAGTGSNTVIAPNNQIEQFDAIAEMTATVCGPVPTSYDPTPYTYSKPRYYAGLEPMPPFSDATKSLSAQGSMTSLHSDFGTSQSQQPSQPAFREPYPAQMTEDTYALRTDPLVEGRPNSAVPSTRARRRASMLLVSGGYDRLL